MSNKEFCKEEYKQLSEDWRNRDRMTWQMPAFLVVIGGVLLVSAFSELGDDPIIRNAILLIGLLFSWVFTIFLTRNIYLQGLGQRLLNDIKDTIINDSGTGLAEIKQCARRVPLHTKAYKLRPAFWDFITPLSSVCLLSLCSVITGILFLLIWGSGCELWVLWGFLASAVNIGSVFTLSHLYLNNVEIVYAEDRRVRLRLTALALLIPIILIIFFGFILMPRT